MYGNNEQKGFIALTSAIIIAAVLFGFVVSLASTGFYGRFVILDAEFKEESRALAEACIQTAILEYEIDNDYIGDGDERELDGNTCTIKTVGGSPSNVQIDVHADVKGSITNLRVVVDSTDDYDIESWRELAEF